MAINTESPTTFTTCVLIGDAKPLNGEFDTSSPDNTPILSIAANGEFVDAALELQSSGGAFLIPRMTAVEFAAFEARERIVDAMIVYVIDIDTFKFRADDDWVDLNSGIIVGPGASTNNAIVRWNGTSGTNIKNSSVLVDGVGNITGVNTIESSDGLIGTPSYSFASDSETGMWSSSVGHLDFSVQGARVLQLEADPTDVNYMTLLTNEGPSSIVIRTEGADPNISLNIYNQGTGSYSFFSGNSQQFGIVGNAVAINNLNVTGAATNAVNFAIQPNISASGSSTNIDVAAQGKGTGGFAILPSTTNVAAIARFWNGAATFYTALQAGVNIANLTLTLPIADASANASASANQIPLSSNGSGAMTFSNLTPRYATLTLTSPQILGMFATPITVIPAPGAGLINVVLFFNANLIFNTTAYAGGGNFYLQYGTTSNSNFRASEVNGNAAFIRRIVSANYSIHGNISDTGGAIGLINTNCVNAPISITNLTGAFTTGDSTVRIKVWYMVVPSN